jgi:excisionase family DNA binding protein
LPSGAKTSSTVGDFRQKTPEGLPAMTDRPETAVRLSERLALSVPEAADSLGISERTMRSILPEIPHLRIGGRVVIPRDLLADWLRQQAGKRETVVGKAVNDILGEIQSFQ